MSRRRASRSRQAASRDQRAQLARRAACRGPAPAARPGRDPAPAGASGPKRRSISSSAQRRRPCSRSRSLERVHRRQQVADVVGGVGDLRLGQRPLRPVAEPLGVLQLHADRLLERPLQRQRPAAAGEAGRQLQVEHARRARAELQREPGQIGRPGRASPCAPPGRPISSAIGSSGAPCHRVDHRQPGRGGDLHQAQRGAHRCAPRRTRCRWRSGPAARASRPAAPPAPRRP